MKNFTETFGTIVEDRLKALNTNAFAAEQRAGLPVDSIRNVLRGGKKSGPTLSRVGEICAALGLEFYIGPRRQGFAEPDATSPLQTPEALRGGWLPMPWHEAARKPGAAPIAFARDWLARHDLLPERLSVVAPDRVDLRGDTGQPSHALIDHIAPRRGGPDIWAFREGEAVILARLQFEGDLILILPKAEDGPTRVVAKPGPLTILGRAVWIGGLV